ncbi:hypothetical protein K461DRAFT_74817 [Myriangium duriaei CBS 260.36]|uniref:Uncharacterized protein n=1 Tax=Myriangium duriaei CBS 260.36 TaxID=1168546 RepID=A0A9P4J9B8_9PEZI|nr:hypothetical protein K461DRAFT_74817 [Myriangium duriaei CBS 260.36]
MKISIIISIFVTTLGSAVVVTPREDPVNPRSDLSLSQHPPVYELTEVSGKLDSYLDVPKSLVNSDINVGGTNALVVSPALGLGTLLGAVVNRLIYFAAAKIAKTLVKAVLDKLLKNKKMGEKDQATIGFVQQSLEKITAIILTKAVGKAKKPAKKLINVGADAGGKVKRDTIEGIHPMSLVTWDLSDDEAHREGNIFHSRAVIDDNLRAHMLAQGLGNVTFAHHSTPEMTVPFLAYQHDDGSLHYHWRPMDEPGLSRRGPDDKHYPFFDAGGAGFKISAEIATGPKTTVISAKDAAAIANLMVKDFLTQRTGASFVGYQEQSKTDKTVGHRLCFIAEDAKFALKNELDKCFGKGK